MPSRVPVRPRPGPGRRSPFVPRDHSSAIPTRTSAPCPAWFPRVPRVPRASRPLSPRVERPCGRAFSAVSTPDIERPAFGRTYRASGDRLEFSMGRIPPAHARLERTRTTTARLSRQTSRIQGKRSLSVPGKGINTRAPEVSGGQIIRPPPSTSAPAVSPLFTGLTSRHTATGDGGIDRRLRQEIVTCASQRLHATASPAALPPREAGGPSPRASPYDAGPLGRSTTLRAAHVGPRHDM
ncbi:hypothetical protein SAMN05421505_12278 [Sinosporangium album]|uniref:Uncharacterized protein n=1 Tax=Sinosporangium album TaxID=504805 RepID=A0A1G8F6X7_9ACTN|nr:hypothetical protein SAMN05421505_12278 [Sinosporangium album]